MTYKVDPDITVASTIDSAFYRDAAAYTLARERIFARTWQWIGDLADVAVPGSLAPRELLPGFLDEPLLLARDAAGTLRCLSNVCTHRGNILVKAACKADQIRCGYHSRRFDLSGRMTFMPEFSEAKNFPSLSDHLPQIHFGAWAGHGFAAIDPLVPLDTFLGELHSRLGWLAVDRFRLDEASSRDYVVDAHWALYVENYLEELHIPFVHPGLNRVVDCATYEHELFAYSSLQVALAKEGEVAFDPPPGAVDHGRRVAAYYWWIFPNLMLNFYPWGLSLNTGAGATRPRASAARTISIGCCASSWRPSAASLWLPSIGCPPRSVNARASGSSMRAKRCSGKLTARSRSSKSSVAACG